MDNLSEEVMELRAEGAEIILCMDANAKIGLMKEELSRNGKLILKVFRENQLEVMNGSDKCVGLITRQNRKNPDEKSAIDFVVCTYVASQWIDKMIIDEDGDYRFRGTNESDHNTIMIDLHVEDTHKNTEDKKTMWNVRAPAEKFSLFRYKLAMTIGDAKDVMTNNMIDISERYTAWEKLLYKNAISSIGKTTFKPGKPIKVSNEMKKLRRERKELKEMYQAEVDPIKRKNTIHQYISKQKEMKEQAVKEESQRIAKRFEKMKETGKNGFWKEIKQLKKDESDKWLITKDNDGKRIFDQKLNKENIANYYENLYKKGEYEPHPYHEAVKSKMLRLVNKDANEANDYDRLPTKSEVYDAICNKKNGKCTSDWKNELLKKGEDEMVHFVYPVIKAFWVEETAPRQWNDGIMTSVWKGKGDREALHNHRGITVSSAIGTIAEEIVFNRVTKMAKFTQAQAGGVKGGSTADHVFILRNIIAIALKQKRKIVITFYDVAKAFDRADMDDMLVAMHDSGVKGKVWRLMKTLNEGLTAKINTKAGLTREIRRETGGKQGGKLMVSLFAKMMDTLASDMMEKNMGITIGDTKIPSLLFVDDNVSFAEGYEQQEETLNTVNEFAIKHKLEWGAPKCKTMEVGTHKEQKSMWKLGVKDIEKCSTYKYLGEQISRNGSNKENLQERLNKVKSCVRAIVTCCKSAVMKRVGCKVALQLHESVTIPTLLYNAETWTLNKTEKRIIDRAEIFALKKMFGLPQTTPTAGIVVTTGVLFSSIRVEMRQLLYLQKVLNKEPEHWTRITLMELRKQNIGWAKQLNILLEKWGLECNWMAIQAKSKRQWKKEVMDAAETMNKEKLREECAARMRGEVKQKTKTRHIENVISDPHYQRKPHDFIVKHQSIAYVRAYIMAKFGMLDCASNFANKYGGKQCKICGVLDDEKHRINECVVYESTNLLRCDSKLDFDDIHSESVENMAKVVTCVLSIWDLERGKNEISTHS